MNRTAWLEETRMKRLEILGRWEKKRLTQEEAAEILGMSDRNFRYYVNR